MGAFFSLFKKLSEPKNLVLHQPSEDGAPRTPVGPHIVPPEEDPSRSPSPESIRCRPTETKPVPQGRSITSEDLQNLDAEHNKKQATAAKKKRSFKNSRSSSQERMRKLIGVESDYEEEGLFEEFSESDEEIDEVLCGPRGRRF